MQVPLVTPAPLVTAHAAAFRDLFENRRQFAPFEPYLPGLLVLENKSRANIARCVRDSADKTNISRFFSATDWEPTAVNARRICYLLAQTREQRPCRRWCSMTRGANMGAASARTWIATTTRARAPSRWRISQ
jgi:hypothetical protein